MREEILRNRAFLERIQDAKLEQGKMAQAKMGSEQNTGVSVGGPDAN